MRGFNSLELFFKKNLIERHSDFIISTTYFGYTVELHSWNKYLIEQYFDNQANEITRITLAGKIALEKYMKEINIAELGLLTSL
jgi:hypothetical protein